MSSPWTKVAAAACATLVGNGLARFAYSPLLPVLIAQGWFGPGDAAYLGAANLLGYLAGALGARGLAERLGSRVVLRGGMLLTGVSLLACCVPMPFGWFFVWRLVSGITGGVLMIVAPSVVLPLVPLARRGLASGLIFTGVGLGIALSGTLVPLLLGVGLTTTWLTLGGASVVLTAVAWWAWPDAVAPGLVVAGPVVGGLVGSFVSYGLCAVGLMPCMVFLVDYVARGLGLGMAAGSLAWVLFGIGALCGAVVVGRLSDAIGAAAAMSVVIATQLGCVLGLAVVQGPVGSGAVSLVSGLCLSGISAAMLGRVQDAAGADGAARQSGWTRATVAWAVGQAAAGYGLAWLYARTGGYGALLAAAAGALVVALVIEAWTAWRSGGGRSGGGRSGGGRSGGGRQLGVARRRGG